MPPGPERRIKLCHIATVDLSIRFLLLDLLLYNKNRGWDVHAVASPGGFVSAIEEAGIVYHPVPITRRITPLLDLVALYRLVRILLREKFDAVHVHTPKGAFLGALAAWIARVPVRFYTIHGFYFHPDMPAHKALFFRFFEYMNSKFVHKAFTVNREDRETAIRLGYYEPGDVIFLGGGIDLTQFDPSQFPAEKREKIRCSLGIGPLDRVIGFVGRLVREKGVLELLEAFKMVRRNLPDARLLIVGPFDPEKKDAISPESVKAIGLDDGVHFTGGRLDIPDLLSIMNVFVLPSYREGFPRSIMEASAMGLPVVATDVRGCREAVENGVTGRMVPVRDAERLSEAILSILSNTGMMRTMGTSARKKALTDFDERDRFRLIRNTYLESMGLPPESAS